MRIIIAVLPWLRRSADLSQVMVNRLVLIQYFLLQVSFILYIKVLLCAYLSKEWFGGNQSWVSYPMVLHGLKGVGTAPPSLGSVDDLLANPRPNCPSHGQIWLWVSDSDFRQADVNLLQWFGWLLMFIGVFKRNKVICGQLGRKKNSCGTPAYSIPTKYVKYKWNTDNLRIPQSATTTTCSRGHHEFLQKNEWMNTCTYI